MLVNKARIFGLTFALILNLLLVTGISPGLSQDYEKEPLTWGMKAGINNSDLIGEDVKNSDLNTNFSGGILINYRFSDLWALQPEILFSIKGAEVSPGLVSENNTASYELGYVNIPVLAKYYFPPRGLVNPNLFVGPEVGFKIYGDTNSKNIDDKLKNTEFGITAGVGLDFNVGNKTTDFIRSIGLDLRYSLGLTDIFDTPREPEARNGMVLTAIFIGF